MLTHSCRAVRHQGGSMCTRMSLVLAYPPCFSTDYFSLCFLSQLLQAGNNRAGLGYVDTTEPFPPLGQGFPWAFLPSARWSPRTPAEVIVRRTLDGRK